MKDPQTHFPKSVEVNPTLLTADLERNKPKPCIPYKVCPKFTRSGSAFLLPSLESAFSSQGLVKDKRRNETDT